VLAGATFVAVRSANRAARIAERSLLAGLRPLLVVGRRDDPPDEVLVADGRVFEVSHGRALFHQQHDVIYLALPLRNAGTGIAQLRGYRLEAEPASRVREDPLGPARHRRGDPEPDPADFAEQQRDLYIAPGDTGFWQAALRDHATPLQVAMRQAVSTAAGSPVGRERALRHRYPPAAP
jgi:hypothetical protein